MNSKCSALLLLFLPWMAAADAEQRYNDLCVACHGEGIDGAPRPGVQEDWDYRLELGVEEVYLNTIDGVGTRMPPRGLCTDCSDTEIEAIVDYMLRDVRQPD